MLEHMVMGDARIVSVKRVEGCAVVGTNVETIYVAPAARTRRWLSVAESVAEL